MQQKTTWTHYSIIGISVITLLLLLISCDKGETEYKTTTNFVYKNLTSEIVEVKLFNENNINFKSYTIQSNNELKLSLIQEGSKNGLCQPFAFYPSVAETATKVTLIFNSSNKCLSYLAGEGVLFVKDYDNFSENMYENADNTLIYNIDNAELGIATICN